MDLDALGWNSHWAAEWAKVQSRGWVPARVAVEDKHHYTVTGTAGELLAHASGKLLHRAAEPELPKVGDWVGILPFLNESKAVIHHVLPRRTKLSRKIPGRETEEQVLVTNIDIAFVVHALDGSFNPRRLQRHLVSVYESGARPVVLINKIDLCPEPAPEIRAAQETAGQTTVVAVSARTGSGIDQLRQMIRKGTTVVFIGSSGVGKSSLINQLYGEEIQATIEVRQSDLKGRHATSWREMLLLPDGGLVIDTPGTREFHMWLADDGIDEAFPEIAQLATACQFRDCGHGRENNCAVKQAVAAGQLPAERYQSYLKLRQELDRLEQARTRRGYFEKKRQAKVAQRAMHRSIRPGGGE